MQVSENLQNEESWTWSRKAILLLGQCLKKRKLDLRNPKIKKIDLWKSIQMEMAKQGYTNLDEGTIERKFRNMKNTYKTIKDNKKKSSTGRGTVKWEYFDMMDDVFEEDKTINLGATVSSISSTPGISRISHENMIRMENLEGPLAVASVVTSEDLSSITHIENLAGPSVATTITSKDKSSLLHSASFIPPSSGVGKILSPTTKTTKAERGKKLYGLRKNKSIWKKTESLS